MHLPEAFMAQQEDDKPFQTKWEHPHSQHQSLIDLVLPRGGNAFRDALISGSRHIFNVYDQKASVYEDYGWSFVHIFIVSGHDDCSAIEELQLISELSSLVFERLKLVIVGVDISKQTKSDLYSIRDKMNQWNAHLEFHHIHRKQLGETLEKIRVEIGHCRTKQDIGLGTSALAEILQGSFKVKRCEVQKYAFLVSLPAGDKMGRHQRWQKMAVGVKGFIQSLRKNDLLTVMTYNSQARLLELITSQKELVSRLNMLQLREKTMTTVDYSQKIPQAHLQQESQIPYNLPTGRKYTIEAQNGEKKGPCLSQRECAQCAIY